MKLYDYFRSSAAYRVRIALNLKGLAYDREFVHLTRGGGEQFSDQYGGVNPQNLVPALDDDGQVLTQSLAIIQYLEETHPEPALLPSTPAERARVNGIALAIACDIHPIDNLRVLNYLTKELGVSDEARTAWYRHWVHLGLNSVEALVAGHPKTGRFCHGDTPGLADICLVPQIFNAKRFDCDLTGCPELLRINEACMDIPAFANAAPPNQPDAE